MGWMSLNTERGRESERNTADNALWVIKIKAGDIISKISLYCIVEIKREIYEEIYWKISYCLLNVHNYYINMILSRSQLNVLLRHRLLVRHKRAAAPRGLLLHLLLKDSRSKTHGYKRASS